MSTSFNITLGNLDQHLTGPSNPATASQLLTVAGLNKFTVHGAPAGSSIVVAMDIHFAHQYGLRQTQLGGGKGGVEFGFIDAAGAQVGVHNVDQGMAMVTTSQANDKAIRLEITFHKAGDYTFVGGAG